MAMWCIVTWSMPRMRRCSRCTFLLITSKTCSEALGQNCASNAVNSPRLPPTSTSKDASFLQLSAYARTKRCSAELVLEATTSLLE